MKVVVLAGGRGTRLGLIDRPKPMVSIGGRPLLECLVEGARSCGFDDFVFLTGHRADVIEDHFGDGGRFGVRIAHVREDAPLGTAGAVLAARHLLAEPFLLLYGDVLIDVDLAHLAAEHRASGAVATLMVHPNDHPYDSDLVQADVGGRIRRFLPKPHAAGALLPNLVNAALYALDPTVLDAVPTTRASDWGQDVFPALLNAGTHLHAYRSVEYAKDMGTPDRLARGEADLASGKMARLSRRNPKPALFLDRDGVLNVEIGGVHRPEGLKVVADAACAVARANDAGVPVIVATNQPALAKGFMTVTDLNEVHAALDTTLGAARAWIDDLFYCPHHPEAGHDGEVAALKIVCDCRKPLPGLLFQAAARHNLDLGRSWMIGDRETDVAAAHAAGARAVLLGPRNAPDRHASVPDRMCNTLDEAVAFVLEQLQ